MAIKTKQLTKKIGNNLIAYGYYQVVTLAIQFILVPFYLKYWGKEMYGEWLVLSGIPTMLTLLDFGVTQASASKATMEAAAGKWNEVKTTLHTAMAFNLGLIAIILPIAIILSFNFNLQNIFLLSKISNKEAAFVLSILFISLCLSMLSWMLEAVFRVCDKYFLGNMLLANRRMLDVIVTAICLTNSFTPLSLVIALLISQCIYLVFVLIIALKISPTNLLGLKYANKNELKKIAAPAGAHLALPVAQIITLQGSTQILQQISGPAAVVAFSMVRTLVRIILQLGQVIGNGLRPEISRLLGKGDYITAATITKKMARIVSLIGIIAYFSIIALSPIILKFWSHGHVAMDRLLVAAIGVHSLFSLLWFVPATLKFAQNKHSIIIKPIIASTLIFLITWIILRDVFNPIIGASILLAAPELAVLTTVLISNYTKKSIYEIG